LLTGRIPAQRNMMTEKFSQLFRSKGLLNET
jgi:hypothetical protein